MSHLVHQVAVKINDELCHRVKKLDFRFSWCLGIIAKLFSRLLTQINNGSFTRDSILILGNRK